jgi:rod shape-determining protein MreC
MSRTIIISKKPVWMALIVALVIHVGLISLQSRQRIDTGFVRVWLLDSLAPMEIFADRGLYGVSYIWNRYIALIGVQDENGRLKRENDELRMQMWQQREAVLEAGRVRALTELKEPGIEKSVIARVIGGDAGRSQTITIDKGSWHGLKPDTAVITPAGIVGRVIHSSKFFSIVQLIIDSQSAVGVLLPPARRQGIVKGNGGRLLDLDYIDDDNDLEVGETFLTSGLDRIYPKGLPVGVITSIGARRGLLRAVEIRPSADLGRLEEVLCITKRREEPDGIEAVFETQAVP